MADVRRRLDWFGEAQAADQRRTFSITCAAVLVVSAPFVLLAAYTEGSVGPTTATFLAGAAAMALNLLLLRRGLPVRFVGAVATCEMFVTIALLTVMHGGPRSAALPWVAMVPLLGGIWVGRRFAMVSCAVVVAFFIGLQLSALAGVTFAVPFTDSQVQLWTVLGVAGIAIFLAATVCFGQGSSGATLADADSDFRMVLENNPDAVLVCKGNEVIYANVSAVEWFGFDSEAGPIDLREHAQEKDRAALEERLRGGTGQGSSPVFRFERPDKGMVDVELSTAIPITFKGAGLYLFVAKNVTARERMEAGLVLADRFSGVGMIAAGVAHELRNPLTAVVGNLEYIADCLRAMSDPTKGTIPLDDLLGSCAEAVDASMQMRSIVLDMGKAARPDRPKEQSLLDVASIVRSSLRMARPHLQAWGRLVEEIESTPVIYGSAIRLGQVFLNLLVNAAHAISEEKAGENSITVRTGTTEGGDAFVEVVDTGCGITSDALPHIFEPFFTTKPSELGTGLGLAISRRIVEEHDGELMVESEAKQGSTFRVTLPLAQRAGESIPDKWRSKITVAVDEEWSGTPH